MSHAPHFDQPFKPSVDPGGGGGSYFRRETAWINLSYLISALTEGFPNRNPLVFVSQTKGFNQRSMGFADFSHYSSH